MRSRSRERYKKPSSSAGTRALGIEVFILFRVGSTTYQIDADVWGVRWPRASARYEQTPTRKECIMKWFGSYTALTPEL